MKPKNHPIEKENHLPSTSILGFKLSILQGVSKLAFRKNTPKKTRNDDAFEREVTFFLNQAGAVASSPDVRKLFGELLEHTYGSPEGEMC